MRGIAEIAPQATAIRERRDVLAAKATRGASRSDLDELARLDGEIRAFDDVCRGDRRAHLMSTGLRWGDQLRHPALPGVAALVRCGDSVEIDGEGMTIAAATAIVARRAGRGVAVADWACSGIRLGNALGLEHPARGTAPAKTAEAMPDAPAQGSLL